MNSLIKGEFFKLKKSRSFKLILIFSLLCSAIFYFYYLISIQKTHKDLNNFSGTSIFYLLLSGLVYENFFSSLIAASFVSKDFEKQTINLSFTYGYSRLNILISKLIVYIIATTLTLYLFIFSCTALFSISYGFGSELTLYCIFMMLKSLIINFLGILTLSTITFLIALITRNSIITIISPFIILLIYYCINISSNMIVSNLLPVNLVINAIINHVTFIDILKLIISFCFTSIFSISLCNIFIKKIDLK